VKFSIILILVFSASYFLSSYFKGDVYEDLQLDLIPLCGPIKTTSRNKSLTGTTIKNPCLQKTTYTLLENLNSQYTLKEMNEVTELSTRIELELTKELSLDEQKRRKKLIEFHDSLKDVEKTKYPRFKIFDSARDDFLYYGIQTGRYKDVIRFLGERECNSPELSWINSDIGYLGLFFSVNQGRSFGGIVRIINEKDVTPIEASLGIYEIDKYFDTKLIPSGHFAAWLQNEGIDLYKTFQYQNQDIHSYYHLQGTFFETPWLYNSCNKSIATISNHCSLDSGMDMEVKEFFYLSDHDIMLGNIYCKKSSDLRWERIATIEMVRTE
jgi:hypothetical protein